jgi:ABC-type transport system substrate-binding protein
MESNTAGFGPYHLESVRAGEQAVFVANPNYFRGAPHFGRVVYRAVPSGASRVTLLKSGQVQWIERPTILQVEDLKQDRRVKVDQTSGRLFAALWMNAKFAPFSELKVRQALNYAIDRDAILKAVFRGEGVPAKSFIAPSIDGQDQSFFTFTHDPARAKQLLAEAGHASGLSVEILYSDIYWWLEAMAIQAADQLKAVGVTATPKRITASDMRARFAPNARDMPFFAWEDGPLVLDAGYAAFLLLHSQGAANRNGFNDPEVDALVSRIRQELDTGARNALLRELQQKVMAQTPWILTFYPTLFEAMAPNIAGWVSHPDDHERWADLREQR